jgi:hypothetical protein
MFHEEKLGGGPPANEKTRQRHLRSFRIRTTTHRRLRQLHHNILCKQRQFFLDNFSTSPILGGDFVSGNLISHAVSN